ncbi:hypothetical protein L8V01_02850 [Corynebacterium sp. c8Ua_181]|uniref:Uncharacterized protein n=1 Tax=Corynebacterium curieae TaxID=2913500 RepID=A0A9X3RUV1_9CORY|nr:hypothetical protein [Corynebacterium curieae]MCZ9306423.1 hypothetical protein [Corynebacterium curieae]MDV2424008.1 hypothetical protein [Corynebacterium curieae]
MQNRPNVIFPSEFKEFSLALATPFEYQYRDFVATFAFFDSEGKQLEPEEVSASWSPKLGGSFRYLKAGETGAQSEVIKPITLNAPARSVFVEVSPWRKKDKDLARSIQESLLIAVKDDELGLTWTRRIKN